MLVGTPSTYNCFYIPNEPVTLSSKEVSVVFSIIWFICDHSPFSLNLHFQVHSFYKSTVCSRYIYVCHVHFHKSLHVCPRSYSGHWLAYQSFSFTLEKNSILVRLRAWLTKVDGLWHKSFHYSWDKVIDILVACCAFLILTYLDLIILLTSLYTNLESKSKIYWIKC